MTFTSLSDSRTLHFFDFARYHRDSDFRDAPEMRLDRHEGANQTRSTAIIA
jgi:hypothetical protein